MNIRALLRWNNAAFLRLWPALVLLSGITFLSITSIEKAAWVKGDTTLKFSIAAGTALGAVLALSRFSGRSAGTYSLFISIMGVIQSVGQIRT